MRRYKFVFYNRMDEDTDLILEIAYISAESKAQAWAKADGYADRIGANDYQLCE